MTKILYFALLAAVGFYWLVLEMVAPGIQPAELGIVKTALMVMAAGTAAAVLFLRYSLIPPLLRDPTLEPSKQLARLRIYYILCYTLAEAVALYGFVLGFLSGSRGDAVPFFLAAVILFLFCYPRTPQTLSGPTVPS